MWNLLTKRSRYDYAEDMKSLTSISGWPDPGRGPLRIEVHLQPIDGRMECVGLLIGVLETHPEEGGPLDILPYGEPRRLKAEVLRQIRLPDLIESAMAMHEPSLRDLAADDPAGYIAGYEGIPVEAAELVEAIEQRSKPTGRKGHPPEHWIKVASVYRQAHSHHRPPTQAVADEFGVSKSTAAKYVARARDLELLPPTTRGRPST
jgi:hypothetical protein